MTEIEVPTGRLTFGKLLHEIGQTMINPGWFMSGPDFVQDFDKKRLNGNVSDIVLTKSLYIRWREIILDYMAYGSSRFGTLEEIKATLRRRREYL